MNKKIITKTIGHIGVDSGQMLLVDPCYIEYPKQLKDRRYSVDSLGAICETGWGDGLYPVEVDICKKTNRICSMKITFIDERE